MKKICARCGKLKEMFLWEDYCYQCEKEQALERQQENIRTGESVDTYSTDYVICPYCGDAIEVMIEQDKYFTAGNSEQVCDECGKKFALNTEVSFSWQTERID